MQQRAAVALSLLDKLETRLMHTASLLNPCVTRHHKAWEVSGEHFRRGRDKGKIRVSSLLTAVIMLYTPTLAFNCFIGKAWTLKGCFLWQVWESVCSDRCGMPVNLDVFCPCTSFSIPSYKTLHLLRSSVSSTLVTCDPPQPGGCARSFGLSKGSFHL